MHQFKRILSNLLGVGAYREVLPGQSYIWRCCVSKECRVVAMMVVQSDGITFSVTEDNSIQGCPISGSTLLSFRVTSSGDLVDVNGILAKDRFTDKVGLISQFINITAGVGYEKA